MHHTGQPTQGAIRTIHDSISLALLLP